MYSFSPPDQCEVTIRAGLFLIRNQDYAPGGNLVTSAACRQRGQSQESGIVQAGTALRGHCSKQWSDMPSSHFLGMSRLTLHNLSEKTSPKSDCLRVGKLFLVSNPNLFLFSFVSVIFISPSLQSVSLFFNESWLF